MVGFDAPPRDRSSDTSILYVAQSVLLGFQNGVVRVESTCDRNINTLQLLIRGLISAIAALQSCIGKVWHFIHASHENTVSCGSF